MQATFMMKKLTAIENSLMMRPKENTKKIKRIKERTRDKEMILKRAKLKETSQLKKGKQT